MTREEETKAFNKLLSLNPQKGIPYTDYIITKKYKRTVYKFKLYSWIGSNKKSTDYPKNIKKHLENFGYNLQIYFDIVILGLTDIDQRPKCPICGKECKFYGTHYSSICEDSYCKKFKRRPIKLSNKFKNLTDIEAFDNTLSYFDGIKLNVKNLLVNKDKFITPNWIIDKFPKFPKEIKTCFLSDWFKSIGITVQTFYDVAILGLTDINQRPKCPICNKTCKFKFLSVGYLVTCNNSSCVKEKIKQNMTELGKNSVGRIVSAETRLKQSKIRVTNLANGKLDHIRNSFVQGTYKSKIFKKDFRYDSSWELFFIKEAEKLYSKNHIIGFDRNHDIIPYKLDNGEKHNYLPDFEIQLDSTTKLVIEIKPAGLLKKDRVVRLKQMAGKKYFRKHNKKYIILTEKELFHPKGGTFWLFDYII